MRLRAPLACVVALDLILAACGSQTVKASGGVDVLLVAKTDLGEPLGGVSWAISGLPLGKTGPSGGLRRRLAGPEGRVATLSAICPSGYQQSPVVIQARLKTTRDLTGRVEPTKHEAVCARERVDVVLVVHTPGIADVAVRVNGRPSAVTDAHGIAQLYLPSSRDAKRVDVTLDTSTQPRLTPANPSRSFELHARDAVIVFEQNFDVKPSRQTARKRPFTRIPYRID